MIHHVWLVLLLLYSIVDRCDAFASELCKRYCDKDLAEGVEMMGTPVELNAERRLRVYRIPDESVEVTHYVPGDALVVKLDPPSRQCVLEVNSVDASSFQDGACTHKHRVLCDKLGRNQGSLLKISENATGSLTIKSGWAKSFGDGVQLSPSVELYPLPQTQNEL